MPNMTALFLDNAKRLWDETETNLSVGAVIGSPARTNAAGTGAYERDTDALYGLRQKRMAAIVFACRAIELFARDASPGDCRMGRPEE